MPRADPARATGPHQRNPNSQLALLVGAANPSDASHRRLDRLALLARAGATRTRRELLAAPAHICTGERIFFATITVAEFERNQGG
jgi:hypothetical protein